MINGMLSDPQSPYGLSDHSVHVPAVSFKDFHSHCTMISNAHSHIIECMGTELREG